MKSFTKIDTNWNVSVIQNDVNTILEVNAFENTIFMIILIINVIYRPFCLLFYTIVDFKVTPIEIA